MTTLPILTTVLFALLTAVPAEWLVTTTGERIETRGPWRVEGARVLFELPNGSLSSIRTRELDLEASRRATEDANRPPTPATDAPATPPLRAALVLNSSNVASATAPGTATVTSATDGSEEPAPRSLRIAEWRDETAPGDDGVRLRGRVANDADTFAATLGLEVTLRDSAGRVLAEGTAMLGAPSLPIGQSCPFEIAFPGQFSYDRVDFDLSARPLLERAPGRDEATAAAPPEPPIEPPPTSSPPPAGARP